MKKISFIYFILFAFVIDASATHVAVLETVADKQTQEKVSLSDRQYLTNVLREEAVKMLPMEQNFTIMTRENINAMLPPGKSIEECEGSCLAETGRNISADYVCQAHVGTFGGELTLSAELYETAGSKLVASFNENGHDVKELLELIRKNAPDFFRKIRSGIIGFDGVSGIGELDGVGEFSFAGRRKFIVEILSNPAEAIPTIDGRGLPKCLSTPCKVQVEEGSHRFLASKELYEDAEVVVNIDENVKNVKLVLEPNFGWLELKPILEEKFADRGDLSVSVDENPVYGRKFPLSPGLHNVRVSHPCYDPVEFKVLIAKNKTEVFEKKMNRGKGGLELSAEYKGVPQTLKVFIDGVESGVTPYSGEVSLCPDVVLKDEGWEERAYVDTRWHEVVKKTHKLRNVPQSLYTMAGNEPETENGETPKKKSLKIHWMPIGIGGAVAAAGGLLATIGNARAKQAAERGGFSVAALEKNRDDVESAQLVRKIGLGLVIVGVLTVGISFAF